MNIPADAPVPQPSPARDRTSTAGRVMLGLGVVLFALSVPIAALAFHLITDLTNDRDNLGAFLGGVFACFATALALAASGLFFSARRTQRLARWFFWLPLCGPAVDFVAYQIYR